MYTNLSNMEMGQTDKQMGKVNREREKNKCMRCIIEMESKIYVYIL